MKRKSSVILPLASALGALAGTAVAATEARRRLPPLTLPVPRLRKGRQLQAVPNTLVSTGETLLGFVMTDQPDGTVVAQHVSHASHASHASTRRTIQAVDGRRYL